MLDDLTKEIKAQLYERVKSPLFGAFALSWIPWNYRPLLATLSGMTFQEKLAYFDSFYPTIWHWIGHCFAGPLTTAVLFLLAYPYPARWVYSYWANQHKELKKVQQRIEDDTPITQEEARALRSAGLAQNREFQIRQQEQMAAIKELEARLKLLQEDNVRITTERDNYAAAGKKAEVQLLEYINAAKNNQEKQKSKPGEVGYHLLPPTLQAGISDIFGHMGAAARDVFIVLVASGGAAYKEAMADYLGVNQIVVTRGIELLMKNGLIDEQANGGYSLTRLGENTALESGLAASLPTIHL